MRRARAQVLIIFAAALPALLGFLGLALDGGYYLAAGQTVQFAAAAAARAAAVDVMAGTYASATSDGTTIGQRNLSTLQLSGVSLTIQYNNTASAAPGDAGWSSATPTASTLSVKAQATGTYNTLFLQLLQVPTVSVDRLAVITIRGGVLPLGVCGNVTSAAPSGPWTVYQYGTNLCRPPGPTNWFGIVGVDGSSHTCSVYKNWTLPGPPTAPAPATGQTVKIDRTPALCNTTSDQPDDWLATAYYTSNPTQPIVVVDVTGSSTDVAVLGCRMVQLSVDTTTNTVTASSPGPLTACTSLTGLQQTS